MQPNALLTTLVGQRAPAWCSTAYADGKEVSLSSADYPGRWYVLYWYPLDFTFVCPTEIRGFQSLLGEFARDGVVVIGASTDSFFSHQAWLEDRKTFRAPITQGIVRSHSVNDLSVGRSPAEVLRTVQALQSGGLCAADWRKGEEFVA